MSEIALSFVVPDDDRHVFDLNLGSYLDQMSPLLRWLMVKGGQVQVFVDGRDITAEFECTHRVSVRGEASHWGRRSGAPRR